MNKKKTKGYTGKNCQFETDPCNPSQCMNGGTCVGNSTHFRWVKFKNIIDAHDDDLIR